MILAVDPGGTTGWATYRHELENAGQLAPQEFCVMAHVLASEWGEELTIVVERFTISQRTLRATKAGSYDAIEQIGVCRYVSKAYCGRDIVMQQPADVMSLVTDDRLRALDWYHPGMPHANDALRHLTYFLARNRGLRIPN